MDEGQREWSRQFNSNFGGKEFLRFSCVFYIWGFLGLALALILGFQAILFIFLFIAFAFLVATRRWKPAYLVFRKILGNKNLPTEPMPLAHIELPREPRPWWSFLPGLWGLLMVLILGYLVIRYLIK